MTPTSTRRGSGTCHLCGRQISQQRYVERHLWGCMPQWETHQTPDAPGPILYAHVNVRSVPYHWMELAIHHDATLRQLDQFLRNTWLECFYHRHSAFRFGEMTAGSDDMDPKLRNSLRGLDTSFLATFDTPYIRAGRPGCTIEHHYDFGTTTETAITTRYLYEIPDSRPIVVIARNNPMKN